MTSTFASNNSTVYSDDDSDGEEAGLSSFFGEAEEAPTRKKRSGDEVNENPQADLTADESLQAEAEAAAKAKKKRAKFEINGPKGLLGSNGLVALHRGLDAEFKGRGHEAEYTSAITSAIKEWCGTLFGGMHWEDLLMRIETVGGKDEVRAQVNLMREGVRKEALTKRYGEDGAERILRALGEEASEEARRQLQIDESGENISDARRAQLARLDAISTTTATATNASSSPMKSPLPDTTTSTITPASTIPPSRTSVRLLEDDNVEEALVQDTSQDEEAEATFDDDNEPSRTSQPQTQQPQDATQELQETTNTFNTATQPQTQQPQETEEEDEAEFEG